MAVDRQARAGAPAWRLSHRARRIQLLLSAHHFDHRVDRGVAPYLAASPLTRGRGKENGLFCASVFYAPVAQRIRVLASEAKGRGFESRRARHHCPYLE